MRELINRSVCWCHIVLVIIILLKNMVMFKKRLCEIYGSEIKQRMISRITDGNFARSKWMAERPLDSIYTIIFLDGIVFNSGKDDNLMALHHYQFNFPQGQKSALHVVRLSFFYERLFTGSLANWKRDLAWSGIVDRFEWNTDRFQEKRQRNLQSSKKQ